MLPALSSLNLALSFPVQHFHSPDNGDSHVICSFLVLKRNQIQAHFQPVSFF